MATVEQRARFKIDIWQEPIEKWLGKRKEVGVSEVLEGALGIPPLEQSQSAQTRVAHILTNYGLHPVSVPHWRSRTASEKIAYWRENI